MEYPKKTTALSHVTDKTLSHNVVSSAPRHERVFELTALVAIGTDCTGSWKSNYHTITTTTDPLSNLILVQERTIWRNVGNNYKQIKPHQFPRLKWTLNSSYKKGTSVGSKKGQKGLTEKCTCFAIKILLHSTSREATPLDFRWPDIKILLHSSFKRGHPSRFQMTWY